MTLTWDRKYDNVLLGQGYHTLHGAVIRLVWSNGGMVICREKPKNSRETYSSGHFVYNESHKV
jgi:hypothetical protein